jgi:CDP-glycerol glycerophosphotransferase (TagB/SpsB family)
MPVYYVTSNKQPGDPRRLLLPNIRMIDHFQGRRNNMNYVLTYLTSKYLFFTHRSLMDSFSDRQIVTNIWHGVLYKTAGVLHGRKPILSDITVGTSQSTRKMFSKAFGVSEDSVYVSGYPRNDMLLEAKKNKEQLKKSIDNLAVFDQIIIWMPTFRKKGASVGTDGIEVGNPFYIKDFNVSYFDALLKRNNTLCLVKPHHAAPDYEISQQLHYVRFIDDSWIARQGITLYQLMGCTDLLISDVSSVIIDYLLLDKPIICVCTDFEEYRSSRGFYFEDIENWIPSRINTNQKEFLNHLEEVLGNRVDPSKQKRKKLKRYFFDYHDAHSTERIVKHALGDTNI